MSFFDVDMYVFDGPELAEQEEAICFLI